MGGCPTSAVKRRAKLARHAGLEGEHYSSPEAASLQQSVCFGGLLGRQGPGDPRGDAAVFRKFGDCSGLSALLQAHENARQKNAVLVVHDSLSPLVRRLFEVMEVISPLLMRAA